MAVMHADNAVTAQSQAATAVTIAQAAAADTRTFVFSINCSYDTAAGIGDFTITVDGVVRFRRRVFGSWDFCPPAALKLPKNVPVIFALASGGAGRIGTLSVVYAQEVGGA